MQNVNSPTRCEHVSRVTGGGLRVAVTLTHLRVLQRGGVLGQSVMSIEVT